MTQKQKAEAQQVEVSSRQVWRDWLEQHHQQADGIWLVTYKKHCAERYVSYPEVVQEALCFGWIDSLPRKLDEDRSMLWLAPRKAGSNWSQVNKNHVAEMIKAGRMTAAGQAKIDQAKEDGSWTALDAVEALIIPDDLAAAFAGYTMAGDNFDAFPRSVKRGILEWIHTAKRPATRAKRIAETARLAADNIRANQWRQ